MSFLRKEKSRANVRSIIGRGDEPESPLALPAPARLGSKSLMNSMAPSESASSVHSKDKPGFPFNAKYEDSLLFEDHHTRHVQSYDGADDYSPRSLIVSLSRSNEPEYDELLKEGYRGFHNRRAKGINIPPLSHPIKPRFKKKSGSLLGKLIYSTNSTRKDSDTSMELAPSPTQQSFSSRQNSIDTQTRKGSNSSSLGSSKHKFRIPSITLHLSKHHPPHAVLRSQLADGNMANLPRTPGAEPSFPSGKVFDLNINLNEIHDIVKPPRRDTVSPATYSPTDSTGLSPAQPELGHQRKRSQTLDPKLSSGKSMTSISTYKEKIDKGGSWKAPDSWDVKDTNPVAPEKDETIGSSSDSDDPAVTSPTNDHLAVDYLSANDALSVSSALSAGLYVSTPEERPKKVKREDEHVRRLSHLPILYGSQQRYHTPSDKGPNHIIRVFKEDNTFTTILCPLETTTQELLNIVQRKFFLESISNCQIAVYIGNCVKVLEPYEKPLKIQQGLLELSGYQNSDNLRNIGREDLSFVCKFVVENILLRNLTHEEEIMLSRDYVDVNILGLNLKNIPIIFHQHTYEIERLVVSDNPSIYIPLDFIQSCNNLTSIVFARNGCSKFPLNFLEARRLTHLDLQKNFLDELPSRFSHLKNLTHVRFNSNQLSYLPRSFGKLTNLVSLNLSSNYFHVYPEPVNDLVNLRDLDLSYNDLAHIPSTIGKLTKLSKLNLSTNKLSKALPECFKLLVSLKRLDIRYNNISNVDVLGSLPNLEVMYASKNNISAFSDEMESLRLLHFDRNPITNLEFRNLLPLLTVLDLSRAKLTSVPSEFISKIPNVEKLVLDKNHLVTLPDELGSLSKLAFLSLYGNNLQVLPNTIGQLTSLQYLDLHSNNLQLLPDDIWNMRSLSFLNVSSNILTLFPKPPLSVAKRISSSANFRNLISKASEHEDDLDAHDHAFTNPSLSLADGLLVLTLADNSLTDICFELISILSELKSLNLSYNDFVEIPEGALSRLTRLSELYLSGNDLTTLPADDIENLRSLKLLYLNNNKLVSLPAELAKLSNLQHLDAGSNQLKYNISNWPYDWNWHWNTALKYLNFSGNKRFEIKQSHIKNPDTGHDFDSLLVLKGLKVLGLIDVTLTTSSVPDQNINMRIRTTASESDTIGYGVSDLMGMRDRVSSRDIFIQKFRGNENEVLICSFDGKQGAGNQAHRISHLAKSLLVPSFTTELNKLKLDEGIQDAIRRTFLTLNKEINGILSAKKNDCFTATPNMGDLADLDLDDDGPAGCSVTIIYIKNKQLYTANIGDIEALLSRTNGEYTQLTTKHDPTTRAEFERIRASGGYVSGDGALDGVLPVSRGVGFFNYLPHTHSGPDIRELTLTAADDMIVIATKIFWDYISYELAVDILRQEKDDPMVAALKLRDYAICYGATDKISVIVITLGQQKSKLRFNNPYNNVRETDGFVKKRRDRTLQAGDLALRRLEDEIEPPVGELALVFTDIKNSTLLWDTYPVAMRSAIKLHNTIMRRQLRIVGGYEVKTEGDAFMVSFPTPTSALLWCFNVQHQLLNEDWPAEILETDQCCEVTDGTGNTIFRGLSVRMGVHWGSPVCELDMVTRRMDYFGPMVNRASRISAIADGGQIAMSSDFYDEINTLFKVHDEIDAGRTTLGDAYHGNPQVGEVIEKEIRAIEDIGASYFELGEKKLKGLETPELVTLVFPKKLEVRFEMFKKRLNSHDDTHTATRLVGALPVESIYGLRTVSLRLESICSLMNGGFRMNEGFQKNSSGIISEKINTDFKEADLISLFNHIVTRIENCVVTLEMRQKMSHLDGGAGRIDFTETRHILLVAQELFSFLDQHAGVGGLSAQ